MPSFRLAPALFQGLPQFGGLEEEDLSLRSSGLALVLELLALQLELTGLDLEQLGLLPG
jgi:hypothetical protein